MISTRALESGVKKYYKTITGNSADGKALGEMLAEMNNNQNTDKRLIGYLNYLKAIRNDLAHPNKRIEQFEVEQTFLHAVQILTIVYN